MIQFKIQIAIIFYFILRISFSQEIIDNETSQKNINQNDSQDEMQMINNHLVNTTSDEQDQHFQKIKYNKDKNKVVKQSERINFLEKQSNSSINQEDDNMDIIEKRIEWSLLFIFGLICAILGTCFEWRNEMYFISFLEQIEFIKSKTKTRDLVDGDLVFVNGKVNYNYDLGDPLFDLSMKNTIKIFRQIEMVQYEEKINKNNLNNMITNVKQYVPKDLHLSKNGDYSKKWLNHRVPILNFKDQDKILKSQKYCKFITETENFQMDKISLNIPEYVFRHKNQQFFSHTKQYSNDAEQNFTSTTIRLALNNNQNSQNKSCPQELNLISNILFIGNKSKDHKPLTPISSKQQIENKQYIRGRNSFPLQNNTMQNKNLNIQPNYRTNICIKDFSCFDELSKRKFYYNQLTKPEKEAIMKKIEDLRCQCQDQQQETNIFFKDHEIIISRKKDSKLHVGDNKVKHFYITANEVSVLGKLSQSTIVPYIKALENDEDIELDDMDDINNSPLLKQKIKKIPLTSIKLKLFQASESSNNQESFRLDDHNTFQDRQDDNESIFTKFLCFFPKIMKVLFDFDDKIFWGIDRIVNFDEFISIKKNNFLKQVQICRYLSFILILISTYFCFLPIIDVFNIFDVDKLEENNPFYIKLFIAVLCTVTYLLGIAFLTYSTYKIQLALIILTITSLPLYIIHISV